VLLGLLAEGKGVAGYDASWFNALIEREILPCTSGRKARKVPVEYDAQLYKERRRIENMFGRLKDWRRIATRYDRCADLFLSACCLGLRPLVAVNPEPISSNPGAALAQPAVTCCHAAEICAEVGDA